MATNLPQDSPYLRTSRHFPINDPKQLAVEINKFNLDVANTVNTRTIGIYPLNKPITGGESWFINSNQQLQNLRQVFKFTAAGNIAHNINNNTVTSVSPNSYGTYTDGTNWYGVIYASSTAIADQVSFFYTPTNIVVLRDAGAPPIVSGYIVLEWLSEP